MKAIKNDSLLIDKMDITLNDLMSCIEDISLEDFENFENCFSSLLKYHKSYIEAREVLHKSISPKNDINNLEKRNKINK